MTTEQKMRRMFKALRGEVSGSCYIEYYEHEDYAFDTQEEPEIRVMKDGHVCWSMTRSELLFEYMTRDWEEVSTDV